MKNFKFKLLLLMAATILFISKIAIGQNQVSRQSFLDANIALLIGINKYPNLEPVYQLNGCVNDVELMKNLLIETFQFNESSIRTLVDEEATRDNIIRQFERFLIDNAKTYSQAVFYYSGHGSQMTDLDGDEMDALDETIVPYDAHRIPSKPALDISDDVLGDLFNRLTNRCRNVTIIMDCGHSGSATRGNIAFSRQIPAFMLPLPKSQLNKSIADSPSGFLPPNPDYVLISACLDRESAYEYDGNGVLTRALNDFMRSYPNATYRETMDNVAAKVNSYFPSQHPQIEGSGCDAIIFGNFGIVENYIKVIEIKNNKLTMNAGRAHNVTIGSIYRLYPPETRIKDETKYLGTAKITKVDAFTSIADIIEQAAPIVKNASAFEILRDYGNFQLAMRIDNTILPILKERIMNILKEHKMREDLVKIVPANEIYEINIRFDEKINSLVLEKPDLTQVFSISLDDIEFDSKFIEMLTKVARYQNILKLENPSSNLQISMRLKRWKDIDDSFNPINELPFDDIQAGYPFLNVDDVIKIIIENYSDKSIFMYLLDMGTDGSIQLLYPSEGAQESPLAPNQSIETPLMRISPPEGLNRLKLIATTAPTDFSILIQAGYRNVNPISASKGLDSPVGKLLNLAWGGKRNVDEIKPQPTEDWTTQMISFMIKSRAN